MKWIALIGVVSIVGGGAGCGVRPGLDDEPIARFTYDHGAVVRGDRTRLELALVFTGGAHGQATATILDVLADQQAPAAFFITGDFLAVDAQRGEVPRMLAGGHYVGPHSHAHPLLCAWDQREKSLVSRRAFQNDLRRNLRALRALGCFADSREVYYIPPYEWYNRDHVRWAREMGVRLINFTPGSGSNRDWIPEDQPGFAPSRAIIADVLQYEAESPDGLNGFLLLLHLGSQRADRMDTELAELLVELKQRGYRLVRVDALMSTAVSR